MKNWCLAIAFIAAIECASAQSLKPEDPWPLKQGINTGTVVGGKDTQYWYFIGGPGEVRLLAHFKSHEGFPGPIELTVTLYDEKRTWHTSKVVSENADGTFIGKLDKKQKTVISVAPPSGIYLIAAGGNYELEATGAVQFEEARVTGDPIIRTFAARDNYSGGVPGPYGATKFRADGTVEASNGEHGTWKAFDPENRIYTVIIGRMRFSLQYVPGRGLVDTQDPTHVVFQELR